MQFEHPDKFNVFKTWLIRKAENGGLEWNQKIGDNIAYIQWTPVEPSWIAQVLGADVAQKAVEFLNQQPAEEDRGYEAGDTLEIWVNQGLREALVLGVHGDECIVEYTMPAGTTALNVLPRDRSQNWGKSVSYRTCPKYWIKAIQQGVNDWEGCSQTGKKYDFQTR